MAARFKPWIAALVCGSFALPAVASDFNSAHNSYVSVNRGQSKSYGSCTYTYDPAAYCKEGGSNYRIAFGHHFTQTWGMEVSYGDFGKAKEQGVFANAPTPAPAGPAPYTYNWEAIGWEIAGTGTLHMGKSFSLIGKVGFIRANIRGDVLLQASDGSWWYGHYEEGKNNISSSLGAQYELNKDVALRLQYEYFGKVGIDPKIRISATSACLVLKF